MPRPFGTSKKKKNICQPPTHVPSAVPLVQAAWDAHAAVPVTLRSPCRDAPVRREVGSSAGGRRLGGWWKLKEGSVWMNSWHGATRGVKRAFRRTRGGRVALFKCVKSFHTHWPNLRPNPFSALQGGPVGEDKGSLYDFLRKHPVESEILGC